ncbi:MAG: two-component sensor kinase [Candidatus Brocadia sinica]|nr:MAG: two-component sensor kinase [Candidatus Brocadia sinica]MCK6467817.1 ATP-binding protein [Candidatus Brocadia sinica]
MASYLSIKARLLIFALCIALIPIAIITTAYYFHSRNALKYQIVEKLKAVAESRERHILSTMERMKVRAIDFSSDGIIRSGIEKIVHGRSSKPDAIIRLNAYLKKNKLPLYSHRLLAIILVDKVGKVISSTNEKFVGKDFSGQDVFVQGIQKSYGETCVGQPQYFPDLHENCIFTSAPIISKHGAETLGVIINVYNLITLNEITTNPVGMGETGEVCLVNEGKIMFTESRFLEDAPLKLAVDSEPVRRIIEKGEEMVGIYKDYRGQPVVGVSKYLPEYKWILLTKTNKAEAFAPLKTLGIIALILGAVSAAAVTSFGIVFAVSTSRPIKDLTKATERFARGDLGHRVKIIRKDEIGFLANSFNSMAEELARVINEHKRAEKELKHYSAELKRSNEELQHFAYVASHDLQEPLRMISSYLQLIKRRYKGNLDADADEFIHYAVDGANRLQKMINGLLEYSRVDTHGKSFELADCEVVLQQALTNLKVVIEERIATITHDPLPTVMADSSQLLLVFQNLITNAIKFRGNEPPRIHISAQLRENEWIFSVHDNGIGIEPEYYERLFVIFRRLHSREYPGVGLGLSICKKVVKRHGGRIWLESEPRKGSTFYFTIPGKRC